MLSGDLQGPDGSSAAFEVFRLSTRYAAGIVERLHQNEAYRRLRTLIKPDVLDAYYVRFIGDRIRPAVAASCVAKYGPPGTRAGSPVQIDPLLYPLLREVWDAPEYYVPGKRSEVLKARFIRNVRNWLCSPFRLVGNVWNWLCSPFGFARGQCRLAVEAGEGVDRTKRSDLFWLQEGTVTPSRLLYYFRYRYEYLKPIGWTKRELDRCGIPWVPLSWRVAGRRLMPWSPGFIPAWTTTAFLGGVRECNPGDPWSAFVMATARELLPEVDYWRAFFRAHNVKVQFSISPSHLMGMAKRMALDLEGGVQIGTQRNFIVSGTDMDTHGRRTQHVFFTWGDPQYAFDLGAFNCGKTLLVSGFTYGAAPSGRAQQTEELRARLKAAGARFTVALFDNSFGDFHITKAMTVRFYRAFLRWLLEHEEAGLVIKPKKPRLFAELQEIQGLLGQAKATGRCVELSGALGRFPGDAAACADVSVGLFLSTAVIEAAVCGHRGVHCDLSRLHRHPFYRWGRGKVVFDDEHKLIEAITQYMLDSSGAPDLGDHAPVLNELDPFRDGQAGRRVGEYMNWLLDAFDAGMGRDGAIAFANERYVGAWGADKMIRLVDRQVGGEGGRAPGRFDRSGGMHFVPDGLAVSAEGGPK